MLEEISNFNNTATIEQKREVASSLLGFDLQYAIDIQFNPTTMNVIRIEISHMRTISFVHSEIKKARG